jgi:hypothetical protein
MCWRTYAYSHGGGGGGAWGPCRIFFYKPASVCCTHADAAGTAGGAGASTAIGTLALAPCGSSQTTRAWTGTCWSTTSLSTTHRACPRRHLVSHAVIHPWLQLLAALHRSVLHELLRPGCRGMVAAASSPASAVNGQQFDAMIGSALSRLHTACLCGSCR